VQAQNPSKDPPGVGQDSSIPADLEALLEQSGLSPLHLGGRRLLPIVQGGMGIGVSAHRLAGTVAALGGVGTISSIDLRRLHPDLLRETQGLTPGEQTRKTIEGANVVALRREIRAAREISGGRGALAVNVMRAVSQYQEYVQCSLEEGIDAVVVGAGLPMDLPDLAKDFPRALLIPILSEARSIQLVVRRWEKRGRLPDAIVVEHPGLAGGHLGASKIEDLHDPRFDFDQVIPQARAFFKSAGIEDRIPLIAAGGINSKQDIARLQSLGAAAVQLGTAFAVSTEGDADIAFKNVLAGARPEDIIEFVSVAGLPARAVRTPWFDRYLRAEPRLKEVARVKPRCTMMFDCLLQCGLRDGTAQWGQFCIDKVLGSALKGDVQRGLFFRGAGRLPFDAEIRPVRDLIDWLLRGEMLPGAIAA
jgi:nitronate monooxygenase